MEAPRPRRPDSSAPGPLPTDLEVAAAFGGGPVDTEPLLDQLAAVALLAARRAAEVLVAGAEGGARHIDTKSSATDMVSEVDRGAEAAIAAVLGEHRPDDGLLAEEGTANDGSTGIRWVVDPLDGTTNFLFGVPQWSVSIAAERDGSPIAGIVVDPSRRETWAALADRPTRRNGRACHVADDRSSLATALVSTGFGYASSRRSWQAQVLTHVAPRVRDLRRFGSAALDLCWVADGLVDAYYEYGLNPWDLAAGQLIVTQAGGRVGVLGDRTIVAAPPSLYGPLVELLEEAGAADAVPGDEPRHWA